jgi:hypothetical protein
LPGCTQALVGGAGTTYIGKLVALHAALSTLDPKKPDTYDAAQHAATDTDTAIKTIALNFAPPTDEPLNRILKAPIYYVGDLPPTEANDAAGGACNAIRGTLSKYPFNPSSSQDATMGEVDAFLKKPDGALWKLVSDQAVTSLVVQFGDTFTAKSGLKKGASAAFINYLNRAANLSHLLYGQNGQAAGFKFTLTPVPSPDVVEHVTLNVNGSIQSTDAHGTPTKEFEWPGNGQGVEQVLVRFSGGSDFNFPKHLGLWGAWRFIDSLTDLKTNNEFELMAKSGPDPITTAKGLPEAVRFTLDPSKAAVMRPRYFSITCVPKVN